MSILLVEDDKKLAKSICKQLETNNYQVKVVHSAEEALKLVENNYFILFILDWRLPNTSGVELCRLLRSQFINSPILMLTARSTLTDKIEGLDSGADDNMTKPFEVQELLARIRTLLRRSNAEFLTPIVLNNLRIEPKERKVYKNNVQIYLSLQEYELLEYLSRNIDSTVSREILLHEIWGIDFDPQSNIVDVYINYLRKKIEIEGLIKAVRGKGYMISST